MPNPELPLSGGQMTTVVRVGDTVRRSTGPWSPAVHYLLRHLKKSDFTEAPRLLGVDDHRREILTYIDGETGFFSQERVVPSTLWSDQVLMQAATLLRQFHDATTSLRLPTGLQWQPVWPNPLPYEVICHNDFAPYNCVFRDGQLIATIDLDGAAPGSRVWDLAYAAYTFVPLYTDDRCRAAGLVDPPDRGRRRRLFLNAYELVDRTGFATLLEVRIRDIAAMIRAHAAAGDLRFQRKIDEGHLTSYITDAEYLRRSRDELQAALEA